MQIINDVCSWFNQYDPLTKLISSVVEKVSETVFCNDFQIINSSNEQKKINRKVVVLLLYKLSWKSAEDFFMNQGLIDHPLAFRCMKDIENIHQLKSRLNFYQKCFNVQRTMVEPNCNIEILKTSIKNSSSLLHAQTSIVQDFLGKECSRSLDVSKGKAHETKDRKWQCLAKFIEQNFDAMVCCENKKIHSVAGVENFIFFISDSDGEDCPKMFQIAKIVFDVACRVYPKGNKRALIADQIGVQNIEVLTDMRKFQEILGEKISYSHIKSCVAQAVKAKQNRINLFR